MRALMERVRADQGLLAYYLSEELKAHKVAVVSLTPGWLCSEAMLEGFGVTEENWQYALAQVSDFANSETPFSISRAVAALASVRKLWRAPVMP